MNQSYKDQEKISQSSEINIEKPNEYLDTQVSVSFTTTGKNYKNLEHVQENVNLLYQYIQSLQMENVRRNQQRITLQSEINQLRIQLKYSYQQKDNFFKQNQFKNIQNQALNRQLEELRKSYDNALIQIDNKAWEISLNLNKIQSMNVQILKLEHERMQIIPNEIKIMNNQIKKNSKPIKKIRKSIDEIQQNLNKKWKQYCDEKERTITIQLKKQAQQDKEYAIKQIQEQKNHYKMNLSKLERQIAEKDRYIKHLKQLHEKQKQALQRDMEEIRINSIRQIQTQFISPMKQKISQKQEKIRSISDCKKIIKCNSSQKQKLSINECEESINQLSKNDIKISVLMIEDQENQQLLQQIENELKIRKQQIQKYQKQQNSNFQNIHQIFKYFTQQANKIIENVQRNKQLNQLIEINHQNKHNTISNIFKQYLNKTKKQKIIHDENKKQIDQSFYQKQIQIKKQDQNRILKQIKNNKIL